MLDLHSGGAGAVVRARCDLPVMGAGTAEVTAAMAAWRVSPGADGAYIDVQEVRCGVVANAALVERECGVADARRSRAGDADIDGVAEDVLRVLGDTLAGGAEDGVGLLSAIAADDLDGGAGAAEAAQDVVEEVEFARVVGDDVLGVVVAEEVVEARDGIGLIVVADAVGINNIRIPGHHLLLSITSQSGHSNLLDVVIILYRQCDRTTSLHDELNSPVLCKHIISN